MVRIFNKIVTLKPSVLAFISGILVSTAINLLTSLMTATEASLPQTEILWVACLFLASAVALMVQSWHLEEPHRQWDYWKSQQRQGELELSDEQIEQRAIKYKYKAVWTWMLIWIVLFLAGFVLLLLTLG